MDQIDSMLFMLMWSAASTAPTTNTSNGRVIHTTQLAHCQRNNHQIKHIKFHHQINRERLPNGHHPSTSMIIACSRISRMTSRSCTPCDGVDGEPNETSKKHRNEDYFLWLAELRSHPRIDTVDNQFAFKFWLAWLVSVPCWLRILTWPLRCSCTAET